MCRNQPKEPAVHFGNQNNSRWRMGRWGVCEWGREEKMREEAKNVYLLPVDPGNEPFSIRCTF